MKQSQASKGLYSDQRGVASLLFSMVMMIVISLIVLSFAQVARNGQRNALDNQLSNQAFLAAETGVNDVSKALRTIMPSITNPAMYNTVNGSCQLQTPMKNALITATGNTNYNDLQDGVSYSCVKVNLTPKSQIISISPTHSEILNLRSSSLISKVKIEWPKSTTDPTSNCPSAPQVASYNAFKPATGANKWTCPYGLIRADVIPLLANTASLAGLRASTMGLFAVPTSSGGSSVTYTGSTARYGYASCGSSTCSLEINMLVPRPEVAMRMISKYHDIDKVVVTGQDAFGNDVSFLGGQVMVDVTGRAQDVSRRIQVRLPINASDGYADNALQAGESICKRFEVSATGMASNSDPDCNAFN